MAKNQRGRNNNNPEGRNQYSSELMSTARDHPLATAAAVAGAVGAGVFLWSNRNRIGNQVNRISRTASEMGRRASRRAGDWMDQMRSSSSGDLAMESGENESMATDSSRRAKSSRSANGSTRASDQPANSSAGIATAS